MNSENRILNMGSASFRVEVSPSVPVGQIAVNPDENLVVVNPAYLEEFTNILRQEFADDDGERAFAV